MVEFSRRLRNAALAAAAVCPTLGLATAAAAAPTLLWEVTGLANPESALPDLKAGVIYVSNVNGDAVKKDGNGFIAKVSLDGKTVDSKWSTGLNAPKGLARVADKLYAADIDELVEIDIKDGKILNKYPAKDAKFLNDAAADSSGNVYVSDMATDTIWKLSGGKFEVWLHDAKLENPNGLLVEGRDLRVAAWGVMTDGMATKTPGHMMSVTLDGKVVSNLGGGKPIGNLDGLEPLGSGEYLITDWIAGKLMKFDADGKTTTLLDVGQGAADIGYDPASKTLYLPQMMKSTLSAYKIE